MTRLASRERLGQCVACALGKLRGKFVDRLDVAFELETLVRHSTADGEWRASVVRIVDDFARRDVREASKQVVRYLRSFDRRARVAELVGEVAQLAGDSAPAAADTRLR